MDEDHDEITAYLILMSYKDKETKTAQQVKKVLGWDGASFVDLMEIERADVPLSWRVKFGTGDYAENLQVSWVAEPDASPTRTVTKISKEDAAALQARYASVLAATAAPVKAVSAKSSKKKGEGAKAPTGDPVSSSPAGAVKPKASTKATAKVVDEKLTKGKGRPVVPKTEAPVGKCSADDAYNACYELKRDDVTEERLNELWQKMVAGVNADETKISEEEWFQIKEKLLKVTAKV